MQANFFLNFPDISGSWLPWQRLSRVVNDQAQHPMGLQSYCCRVFHVLICGNHLVQVQSHNLDFLSHVHESGFTGGPYLSYR